jgi:hypothetical protein
MSLDTAPHRLVLHTTEGTSFPSYSSGGVPHLTFNPATNEVRQHLPFDVAAYTMQGGDHSPNSEAGTTLQVEMIGYAKDTPTWPAQNYENLRALIMWFYTNMAVPYVFPFPFTGSDGYGTDGAVRQTWDAWASASGIVGHSNAPYNEHWDPGALDTARLMSPPVEPPEEDHSEFLTRAEFEDWAGAMADAFRALADMVDPDVAEEWPGA